MLAGRVPQTAAGPPARPWFVTLAVVLWWVVLGVGIVSQLLALAAGGLYLAATAPDQAPRLLLLFGLALLFPVWPVVHWAVQAHAITALRRGRGRPRIVLSVLAISSVLFDVVGILAVNRVGAMVACAVHPVLVLVATVVMWLPPVTEWFAAVEVTVAPAAGPPAHDPGATVRAAPAGIGVRIESDGEDVTWDTGVA